MTQLQRIDSKKLEISNKFLNNSNDENVLLKALGVLQGAKDIASAINEVLEMIGEDFDVTKVFIYELVEEGKYYANTYEWCAEGIEPIKHLMQRIPAEKYKYMESYSGKNGVYACNDISQLEGSYRDLLESQGIQSFLHGFIKINDIPQILIGVEDSRTPRVWSETEITSMVYLSNLLGMFSTQVENIDLMKKFVYLKDIVEVDKLTRLPTKEKFYEDTLEMIKSNPTKQFVFVLLNINKFQMINSFFGMEEGDRLLKLIGNQVSAFADQPFTTYARMGADIFCVCQEIVDSVEMVAKQITEKINSSIIRYRCDYNLSASIGIFVIKNNNMPLEMIYSKAFIAAKTIKHLKTTDYSIYEDHMEEDEIHEQTIINDMIPGLIEHQFVVYLQPKVDLQSGEVIGAEALIRWNHPTMGFISPGDFVPIFEKNGLITKIDYFVWDTVCQFLQESIANGIVPIPISVNISRVDLFNINLISCFEEFLKKYNIPAKLLHLEITESACITDYDEIGEVINRLRDMGFHIEMDDFGSGYSSLNMFSEMIVDTLKLDMIFLKDLHENSDKYDILTFIVSLAKHFNLPVVAEGIETLEQCELLKGIGCDIGQGYYFARPMPMEQFLDYVKERENRKEERLLESKQQTIELYDIFYPNGQSNNFFQKALGATIIFKLSDGCINIIRCNKEFHEIVCAEAVLHTYKENIMPIFHDDDINLLRSKIEEAKEARGTIAFQVRIRNFDAVNDLAAPQYNYFNIAIKSINHGKKTDIFTSGFVKIK